MTLSEAARKLRQKPCTCGKGSTHFGPHESGCPRYMDRTRAKRIIASLVEQRHREVEGEWMNLAEFRNIDLFSFHLWGEWPDAKKAERTGLERGARFHRRVAYEVKVTRADFRSEMRNPRKREPAMALCHQFFFATPAGLVRKDEIPADCGLVEVSPDGTVRVVKHAPMRRPTASLTTTDVVALLRAKHLGPSAYEYREQATRASRLLKSAEVEHARSSTLVQMARVRMIREKGHLLLAGSEWVGPWSVLPNPMLRKRSGDVRVRVTSARVDEHYEDEREPLMRAHNGTVYVKPVEEIERDGDTYSGTWLDPGDFLIAFRHEAEPARIAPPPDTSLHHRPRLRSVDG